MTPLRLGVNIDHVATLRNARGGVHPCPVRAAELATKSGADSITIHLREDRRHIRDDDVRRLRAQCPLPLNLEIALTEEMVAIACELAPHAVCIVPERREELTTEGGLDVRTLQHRLPAFIQALQKAGIAVSLFIDPDEESISLSESVGANAVELHTGKYALNPTAHLPTLQQAARHAKTLGLAVHAGHGLTLKNVGAVAAIMEIEELNIGHFIIGESVFFGMESVITAFLQEMNRARNHPTGAPA